MTAAGLEEELANLIHSHACKSRAADKMPSKHNANEVEVAKTMTTAKRNKHLGVASLIWVFFS